MNIVWANVPQDTLSREIMEIFLKLSLQPDSFKRLTLIICDRDYIPSQGTQLLTAPWLHIIS